MPESIRSWLDHDDSWSNDICSRSTAALLCYYMPLLQDQYSDTSRIAVVNIVIPLYSTTADISHNGLPEKP